MKKFTYLLLFAAILTTHAHALRRSTEVESLDQDPETGQQVAPVETAPPREKHANARKNWRRFGLIAGGVAVAAAAIVAVNNEQGRRAN